MSSHEVHQAGIRLESIVNRLGASLKGTEASNNANYYDYRKGLYDGVASCLESMEMDTDAIGFKSNTPGSPGARYDVCIKDAIKHVRQADSRQEDPDRIPNVAQALVAILGALEAVFQHSRGNDAVK